MRLISRSLLSIVCILTAITTAIRADHASLDALRQQSHLDLAGEIITAIDGVVNGDMSDRDDPRILYKGSAMWSGLNDLTVVGDYAYCTAAYGLVVLDIGSPGNPIELSQTVLPTDYSYDVRVSGNYAYIANGAAGVKIISIGFPQFPLVTDTKNTPGSARGVDVVGSYLYVADGDAGLQIHHASPFIPLRTGRLDTPGFALNVVVRDNLAYIADYNAGLQIIDVSNPVQPVLRGNCATPGDARAVELQGDYAYVADGAGGLQVVNISNPSSPSIVGTYTLPASTGYAIDVTLAGSYAYVANYDVEQSSNSSVEIVNISAPSAPSNAGRYDTGWLKGIYAAGGYLYLPLDYDGLSIMSLSNPTNPSPTGFYESGGLVLGVEVNGDYAFVADWNHGLKIVDITDPVSPEIISQYYMGGANRVEIRYVDVNWISAYVTSYLGFEIVEVTNPSAPSYKYFYPSSETCQAVVIGGDYAFMADGEVGVEIIDVTDEFAPAHVSQIASGSYANDVHVVGDRLYVGDDDGLYIYDVSNVNSPQYLGFYDTPGWAFRVKVYDQYAYVIDFDEGLYVLDVSNPQNPQLTGRYADLGRIFGLDYFPPYLYIGDDTEGLKVIDVSNPASPRLAATYRTPGYPRGVDIDGLFVYMADYNGFIILDKDAAFDFAFEPNPNGWSFGNTPNNMWPEDWWQQFADYGEPYTPLDPNSGEATLAASVFPDWPLFVSVYGEEQCYFVDAATGKREIDPLAAAYWRHISGGHIGSCFGFSVSAFLHYADLSWVGGVDKNLYEYGRNDYTRALINGMQIQRHSLQTLYNEITMQYNIDPTTPVETLDEIKTMIQNDLDPRVLMMTHHMHAVSPWKVEPDPGDPDIEYIYVYDSNNPGDENKKLTVKRSTGEYWYDGSQAYTDGLFLSLKAGDYLETPLIPPNRSYEWRTDKNIDSLPLFACIYWTDDVDVTISNGLGQRIGNVSDSTFDDMDDAVHIVPFGADGNRPHGVYLRKGDYDITATGAADSIVNFGIFSDSVSFFYAGRTVETGETAGLGLSFADRQVMLRNENGAAQVVSLAAVSSADDTCYYYRLYDCELGGDDSLEVALGDPSSLDIVNPASGMNYGLYLMRTTALGRAELTEETVTLAAGASHAIQPEWASGPFTAAMIYIDDDSDGIVDDSLGIGGGDVCGDANGDALINVGDAVYLISYVFKGGPAPEPLCLGDANSDGFVNVGDAVYLINYTFKGGPAPVPTCCD